MGAMASKKQTLAKQSTASNASSSRDQRLRKRTHAIERSLEAMSPPIDDVYEGILKLIAEFAEHYGKNLHRCDGGRAPITLVIMRSLLRQCCARELLHF